MALRIELYSARHIEQVRSFNARLRQGKVDSRFLLAETALSQYPEDPLERTPAAPFAKRQVLALDDDQVRGGFLLQEQACEIAGETHWCANIQMPISEGLVDHRFSYVAIRMLQLLLRDRPFVFAVGMGSIAAPFARFLSAMNWRVSLVPFRFYVFRTARFLHEIRPLHSAPARSIIANIAAWTGLGTAGIWAAQRFRARPWFRLTAGRIEQWDEQNLSPWSRYRSACSFAAVRDPVTLPFFLDSRDPRLSAYQLADRAGVVRGWIVLQVTEMRDNQYFGSLRVATLLDSICEPSFERAVVGTALACARDLDADILITNQQHHIWLTAGADNGFWKGPSNYVFAASPELTRRISAVDPKFERVHLSRADGDGRLNL